MTIDLGLELSEQNPDLQTAATSVGEMAMAALQMKPQSSASSSSTLPAGKGGKTGWGIMARRAEEETMLELSSPPPRMT